MKLKEHELLGILAEPNRFRIFKLLLQTRKEICNCEFVDALKIPKYGLSKHLDTLSHAGLVKARKDGRWVYYSACLISGSDFCSTLCKAIREVNGELYGQDLKLFSKRLDIRVKGKCVLGVQGRKLTKCC